MSTKKTKILLVEDEVIAASSIKMGLEELGYEVCPLATRADRALELAESEQPDIILMDVNLPGGRDGIETAAQIMSRQDVKIMFLTGYHDDEIMRRISELNPLGHLIKPVSAPRIHSLLEKS